MSEVQKLSCPFCGFSAEDDYRLMYHVEIHHHEDDDSPFAVKDAMSASKSAQPPVQEGASPPDQAQSIPASSSPKYVDCPHNCGERIAAAELQSHIDFHVAEDMALDDVGATSGKPVSTRIFNDTDALKSITNNFSTSIAPSLRNHGPLDSRASVVTKKQKRTPSLKELFFGSPSKDRKIPSTQKSGTDGVQRLGKAELGPYAHEKQMPSWLYQMLEDGAKVTVFNKIGPDGNLIRVETIANETPNLVHVLSRLSVLDKHVARAFYCSPEVRHVVKMRREGGFCGYRNIQMLISYIVEAHASGNQHFKGRIPSILKLQDMIEEAWDRGYNTTARLETGGIKLTRKYIGTPEAQALFQSLRVPCEAIAFSTKSESGEAYVRLLQSVFEYFDQGQDHSHRVVVTEKPPIYFQHKGHSMTIVGVEVYNSGAANLVVFDPMFNPSPTVKKLIDANSFQCSDPAKLLKAHRRGETYLSKYKDFELLKLTGMVTTDGTSNAS